jgi:FKBP-type peptidyl-prolyl cis-trans isomerase FkpA
MRSVHILFLILSTFLCSCSHKQDKDITAKEIKNTEEALVGANRMLIQKDKAKIEEYIRKQGLSLSESESGLWYEILKAGSGNEIKEGMTVTLSYEVTLLDGTKCYDSDSLGLKQFLVGQGGVESGLEEGVLKLRAGSEAILILPPHLAYGLPGDGDRIPRRSIIVYHIEIIKAEP